MDMTPLVARVFYLVLVLPRFGSNGSGVPDFGIYPLFFVSSLLLPVAIACAVFFLYGLFDALRGSATTTTARLYYHYYSSVFRM